MTKSVRTFILLLVFFLTQNCLAQKKDISGTYFNTFSDPIGFDNCCRLIEVFRLNKDKTFNYYRKNDQGDYIDEKITYGHYKIIRDSVFFASKPDSTKKSGHRSSYFEYSGFKMKILDSCLETLQPIGIVAGGRWQITRYYKANFNDFDSLKISVDKSDSLWNREYLVIMKDKRLMYSISSTNYKTKQTTTGHNEIKLSAKKYKLFLKILSESPLFEPTGKNYGQDNYVMYLYLKDKTYINGVSFFSQKLYNFLFKELMEK